MESRVENVMDIPNRESRSMKIGQGSFASIWGAGGLAFKVCLQASGQDDLKQEFELLAVIYKTCNSNPFFLIPRALAFSTLQEIDLLITPASSGPAVSSHRRRPDIVPARFEDLRLHGLETAAFALSRVREITLTVAEYVRQQFYPAHSPPNAPLARLCRLYLGKPTTAPSRFLNTNNFILDLQRYAELASAIPLPSPAQVAFGMGETLGRLHFAVNVDARDIEFVLGSTGEEISEYYCFDFNQVSAPRVSVLFADPEAVSGMAC